MPDGGTTWSLSLMAPTTIHYEIETPDIPNIIIAMVIALCLLGLVGFALLRNSRRKLIVDTNQTNPPTI